MRIISGTLKGREVKGFNLDGTRPTMDRVKESLFAMIQNKVRDSIVLDLFAGSGNLGIEAISNGSKQCYFNDINKECVKVINENIKKFKIEDNSILINKSWEDTLKYLESPKKSMLESPILSNKWLTNPPSDFKNILNIPTKTTKEIKYGAYDIV